MQIKYSYSGPNVYVHKLDESTVLSELKPKIYEARFDKFTGFYLETFKEQFEIPNRIYGTTLQRADKCISTYKSRENSTGILMTGDKGTGKTLLMSILSNKVINELDLPVIVVGDGFSGAEFLSFIQNLGECCIVFDEFGKTYKNRSNRHHEVEEGGPKKSSQDDLLSLMDGLDKTKRLFILTENRELDISEFFLNRPSRIYYHFRYSKLEEDGIKDYCQDKGVEENICNDIIDLSRRLTIFSFDILQSLVEEHLRYNESVEEIISNLNIDKNASDKVIEVKKVISIKNDEERKVKGSNICTERHGGYSVNIFTESDHEVDFVESTGQDDEWDDIWFTDKNITYEMNNNLVFETNQYRIIAKRVQKQAMDYWKVF